MNPYVQKMILRIMEAESRWQDKSRDRTDRVWWGARRTQLALRLFNRERIVAFGHMEVETWWDRECRSYVTVMRKDGIQVGGSEYWYNREDAALTHWGYVQVMARGGETPDG